MIQKLQDQILSEKQFTTEYNRLKADYDLADDAGLISECMAKLSINGDNRAVLTALHGAEAFDQNPIIGIIEKYQGRHHDMAGDSVKRLTDTYAARYHITGSAVTPNPNRDDRWRREEDALEKEFRKELKGIAK